MTDTRSSKAIEAEIEKTRKRLEQRIDSLGTNLAPSHLVQQALATNPGTTQETVSAVIEKARTNPVSALLVGAGIAGLFLANQNEQSRATSPVQPERDDYNSPHPMAPDLKEGATPEERIAHNAAVLEAQARSAVTGASAALSNATDSMSDTASAAVHSVKTAAAQTGDRLVSATQSVGSSAQRGVTDIRNATAQRGRAAYASAQAKTRKVPTQARIAGDRAMGWVKENPVPAGLLALAAGAAAASFFATSKASKPRTRTQAGQELYDLAERDAQLIPTATPAPTDPMPAPVPEMEAMPKPRKRAPRPKTASASKTGKAARSGKTTKNTTSSKSSEATDALNGSKALKRGTAVLGEAEADNSGSVTS